MKVGNQHFMIAAILIVAAAVSGEFTTAAAGISALLGIRLGTAMRGWRDPLARELRRLARDGEKIRDVITTSAGVAFVSPAAEYRNPIGSLADMWLSLDDGVQVSTVTHSGEVVSLKDIFGANEPPDGIEADCWTLEDLDGVAEMRGGDWTVAIEAPLWSATWQREAKQRWVCVEHGRGYALHGPWSDGRYGALGSHTRFGWLLRWNAQVPGVGHEFYEVEVQRFSDMMRLAKLGPVKAAQQVEERLAARRDGIAFLRVGRQT